MSWLREAGVPGRAVKTKTAMDGNADWRRNDQ